MITVRVNRSHKFSGTVVEKEGSKQSSHNDGKGKTVRKNKSILIGIMIHN